MCFVNIKSSLHENVVGARMGNAAYIIFIMWNSISGLDAWYHFRFNISCGGAVTVKSHQNKNQVIFKGRGEAKNVQTCVLGGCASKNVDVCKKLELNALKFD